MTRTASVLAIALGLSACGATPPANDDAGIALDDSGAVEGCAPSGGPAEGTSLGRTLPGFTLNRCDGTPFSLYGEDELFCESRFTVVTIGAGWCGPCRLETGQIEAELVDNYADDGVRVVQVLIQDNDYAAPTPAFCDGWVTQYDLSIPVLLDPSQVTTRGFPAGSLPANLIIDSNGVIRHREYGVSAGLRTIRAAIDELLAEAP